MTLLFTACDSDEKITDEGVSDELLTSAKNYLTGDIILSTKATMSGVDKTLLPQGCPTKFGFKWSTTDKNTFNITDNTKFIFTNNFNLIVYGKIMRY